MTPPSDSSSSPGSPSLQPLLGVPRAELYARPNSHPFQNRVLLFTGPDQQIKVGRSVARSKPSPNNGIFDCKGKKKFWALDWRNLFRQSLGSEILFNYSCLWHFEIAAIVNSENISLNASSAELFFKICISNRLSVLICTKSASAVKYLCKLNKTTQLQLLAWYALRVLKWSYQPSSLTSQM